MRNAAGQGALIGSVAGMIYAAWEIFLQQDLGYGFHRLAASRFAWGALAGGAAGTTLSVLLWLVLEILVRAGRRLLLVGRLLLAIGYLAFLALAALPYRAALFPHHKFSSHALSVAIFCALALTAAGLLACRMTDAGRPAGTGPAALSRVWGIAGWATTCVALLTWLVVPRLPMARGATGKSIILVSIDTLRADRVGVYGCVRPLTPRIDALARQGAVFEQATAAAPWTLPSHAALFTSLLPFTSDARNEHRYPGPGLATLAERLKNAGYRTAAFTGGGYVFSGLGFDQGFDVYQDHDETAEGGPGTIMAEALAWIRSMRGRPFFAFVHTYALHFPYRHAEFTDPESPAHGRIFGVADLDDVQLRGRVLAPEERRQIRDLYDGGVHFADGVIGGLLETLRQDGILDSAVLVILSDHGEDLWDHDGIYSPGHGHSLYQEQLRVPLIVRAPGLIHGGTRIRTPVSLLDVLPTLRELTGLPASAPEEGRTLARTLLTGEEPKPVPIFSEATEYGPDRFALRQGDLKIIVAPRPDVSQSRAPISVRPLEIFDLSLDPEEKASLAATATPLASIPTVALWKRVTAVFTPARETDRSDAIPTELRDQLRSLGYTR